MTSPIMDLFCPAALVLMIMQFRFLSLPMHVDCGNLRYPGLMLARGEIDHRQFAVMSGHLGNKIAIFYFNLLASRLFAAWPVAGPKLFYLGYSGLTALVVHRLFATHISPESGCLAVFLYALLAFSPRFYSYYDSIEKFAHLPLFLLLGWTLAPTPLSAFLAAMLGPILFFLFKPTYILEWLPAAGWLAINHQLPALAAGVACGMIIICLIAMSRRGDLRELRGYCRKLHLNGNLIYLFKFRNVGTRYDIAAPGKSAAAERPAARAAQNGKKNGRTALFFLLPALPALLMIVFFCVTGLAGLPMSQRVPVQVMFLAAIVGLLIQFRFFGYHFLPLVPYGVFGGTASWATTATHSWQHVALLLAAGWLFLEIIRFFFYSDEAITRMLFKKVPHYLHRNLASVRLAARLRGERIRSLLQWDEGRHLNVLLGIPTPADNDEVAPWSYSLYPAKAKAMLMACCRRPPEVLIPMIDNINWQNFTALTGLHFTRDESATIIVGNEAFPLYRLSGISPPLTAIADIPDAELSARLFTACRCVAADQRRIWNSISTECPAP